MQLGERLSQMGAQLLIDTLDQNPTPMPEDNSLSTFAPILYKEDGLIDWTRPAPAIHNQIRGLQPWPGGHTTFRGGTFNLWKARVGPSSNRTAGLLAPDGTVSCGGGTTLELLEVQLEGRKRIDAKAFLNGLRLTDNETLGATLL